MKLSDKKCVIQAKSPQADSSRGSCCCSGKMIPMMSGYLIFLMNELTSESRGFDSSQGQEMRISITLLLKFILINSSMDVFWYLKWCLWSITVRNAENWLYHPDSGDCSAVFMTASQYCTDRSNLLSFSFNMDIVWRIDTSNWFTNEAILRIFNWIT